VCFVVFSEIGLVECCQNVELVFGFEFALVDLSELSRRNRVLLTGVLEVLQWVELDVEVG